MGGAGSLEEGLSCFEGEDPACPVDCQGDIVGAVECVSSNCGGPTGDYGPPEGHGYGPPEGSYTYGDDEYGYEPTEEEFEEALNHLEETAMELGPVAAAEEAFPDNPVARDEFLCAEENCGELLIASNDCLSGHGKVESCMECGGPILMGGEGSLEEGLSCFEGEDPACPIDCQDSIVGAVQCVVSHCGSPAGGSEGGDEDGSDSPDGGDEDGSYAYLKIA
jgi:hypothetical protein